MSTYRILTLGVLLAAPAAWAQPNPFEAYDTGKTTVEQPAEAPGVDDAVQAAQPVKAPGPKFEVATKGRMAVGFSGSFSSNSTTNDLAVGGEVENSTTFLRFSPTFGYYVIDRLEVSGSVGLLLRDLDRGGKNTVSESSWMVEASGRYFLPFSEAISAYAGLGLGAYFGSSTTEDTAAVLNDMGELVEQKLKLNADSSGLALLADFGFAYLFLPEWQLRAGLDITYLIGSEEISGGDTLDQSTFNMGLNLGFRRMF